MVLAQGPQPAAAPTAAAPAAPAAPPAPSVPPAPPAAAAPRDPTIRGIDSLLNREEMDSLGLLREI
jgi:hypothetical protein